MLFFLTTENTKDTKFSVDVYYFFNYEKHGKHEKF